MFVCYGAFFSATQRVSLTSAEHRSTGPKIRGEGDLQRIIIGVIIGLSGSASIDNIGFAIPINSIRGIVESIIEKGYITKPYIGIRVVDVSAETQQYGIPAGAAIQSVTENSPAALAGLQRGDVITAVDGKSMTSTQLVSFVSAASVGQQITFTVYRQGKTLEITVDVGEQIQSAPEQEQQQNQQGSSGNFPWGRP